MTEPSWIEPWSERSAALYELVFSSDDHDAHAAYVTRTIEAHHPSAGSLLDVACGTGWHLERFARRFEVEGADRSAAMLARARGRLAADVPLHRCDMRMLDLPRAFDAITCLSSSIAWLPDREALEEAIDAMARHLAPGGVLVVEPWDDPDDAFDPSPWTRTVRAETRTVSLMETTVLDGDRWVQETHYLIWEGGPIEHVAERATFSAFRRADLERAIEHAGLRPVYDEVGALGRGLWIGLSPPA